MGPKENTPVCDERLKFGNYIFCGFVLCMAKCPAILGLQAKHAKATLYHSAARCS